MPSRGVRLTAETALTVVMNAAIIRWRWLTIHSPDSSLWKTPYLHRPERHPGPTKDNHHNPKRSPADNPSDAPCSRARQARTTLPATVQSSTWAVAGGRFRPSIRYPENTRYPLKIATSVRTIRNEVGSMTKRTNTVPTTTPIETRRSSPPVGVATRLYPSQAHLPQRGRLPHLPLYATKATIPRESAYLTP